MNTAPAAPTAPLSDVEGPTRPAAGDRTASNRDDGSPVCDRRRLELLAELLEPFVPPHRIARLLALEAERPHRLPSLRPPRPDFERRWPVVQTGQPLTDEVLQRRRALLADYPRGLHPLPRGAKSTVALIRDCRDRR